MILAIAAVAATAYLMREWYLLRDARQQFDFAWAGWNAGRATHENVVLSSARLMQAEADSLWFSHQSARRLHIERLNRLLADIESHVQDRAPESVARQATYVRGEIEKLGAVTASPATSQDSMETPQITSD
jgi:hypothetical protein